MPCSLSRSARAAAKRAGRRPRTAACSCRCDGPDANGSYCTCPAGYACTHLIDDLGLSGSAAIAGSYCVKDRTQYDPQAPLPNGVCTPDPLDPAQGSCGPQPAP